MANIVRLRVERKDEPDAFKNMLKAYKRQRGWIEKEHKIHSSHETPNRRKRRKRRKNLNKRLKAAWLKKQSQLYPWKRQEDNGEANAIHTK